MDTKKLIEAAKKAIGENALDDYIINPTRDAKLFEKSAPVLSKILKSSDVQATAQEYEKWDQRAIAAQKRFKSVSNKTNWTIIGSACCTAGLLVLSVFTDGTLPGLDGKVWAAIFALGGMFFGAAAGLLLNMLRSGRMLQKWMKNRAEAEMLRLQLFNSVTSKEHESTKKTSIPTALLQLEYFRRFQLDLQKTYYSASSEKHDSAAQKALIYSSVTMGVVAMINGASGYLASTFDNLKWTAIAAIAVIAKAFVTKISNTQAINQDARSAERYQRSSSTLTRLSSKLDDVRKQILSGDKEILNEFVEAVHEQLSLEHRQWIESISKAGTAIGKFEKHLEDLKEKKAN